MRSVLDGIGLSGGLEAYISGGSTILVPPKAEILTTDSGLDYLEYPIPSLWTAPLTPRKADLCRFLEAGWTIRQRTDGLLDDIHDLIEAPPSRIARFAEKWGPIWLCMKHDECLWNIDCRTQSLANDQCEWLAMEPLEFFRMTARQITDACKIVDHLLSDKPAPIATWQSLLPYKFPADECLEIDLQRAFLACAITEKLAIPGGPVLRVNWTDGTEAELTIETGLGFVRRAWLQVAQLLTGARGVCVCDGCGRAYIRHRRKPRRGGRNYCPSCGKTAAKREWATRNRTRLTQSARDHARDPQER